MCRFFVYFGSERILLADLITKPKHSIVQQSFCDPYLPFMEDDARRLLQARSHKVNGDGFGVAWYGKKEPVPCVFTSIKPSWSDLNLQRLAQIVRSHCVFGHVRAASPKSLIVETNCHPFQPGRLLFMHNGCIGQFKKIRKSLLSQLSEKTFAMINGTTDTEHAMALFVSHLPNEDPYADHSGHILKEAMLKTIDDLLKLSMGVEGASEASSMNFAVTNGQVVIATRFRNSIHEDPPSLYYTKTGHNSLCSSQTSVVISSEPLTFNEEHWALVPKNHLMVITTSYRIHLEPIEVDPKYMIHTNPNEVEDSHNPDREALGNPNSELPVNKKLEIVDTLGIVRRSPSKEVRVIPVVPVVCRGEIELVENPEQCETPSILRRSKSAWSLSVSHELRNSQRIEEEKEVELKREPVVSSAQKPMPMIKHDGRPRDFLVHFLMVLVAIQLGYILYIKEIVL